MSGNFGNLSLGFGSDAQPRVQIEFLCIGGGGGGSGGSTAAAGSAGSGGGAGGYLTNADRGIFPLKTYAITVGAGGAAGAINGTAGTNGANSVISGTGLNTVTALGGGGASLRAPS